MLHPKLAAVAGRRMGKPKELPSLKHSLELLDSNFGGEGVQGLKSDSRHFSC